MSQERDATAGSLSARASRPGEDGAGLPGIPAVGWTVYLEVELTEAVADGEAGERSTAFTELLTPYPATVMVVARRVGVTLMLPASIPGHAGDALDAGRRSVEAVCEAIDHFWEVHRVVALEIIADDEHDHRQQTAPWGNGPHVAARRAHPRPGSR